MCGVWFASCIKKKNENALSSSDIVSLYLAVLVLLVVLRYYLTAYALQRWRKSSGFRVLALDTRIRKWEIVIQGKQCLLFGRGRGSTTAAAGLSAVEKCDVYEICNGTFLLFLMLFVAMSFSVWALFYLRFVASLP